MGLIVDLSKYMMILLMGIYTYFSFKVYAQKDLFKQQTSYIILTFSNLLLHFMGHFVLYIQTKNNKILVLYCVEVIIFAVVLALYQGLYKTMSKLLLQNMILLLSIGFIMLTRLSYDKAVRQVVFVGIACLLAAIIPWMISKCLWLRRFGWIYGVVGIGLLLVVLLLGKINHGAKNWLEIGFISIQPSEFVKILYVFCIAGLLHEGRDFKRVCAVTVMAAANVMILVVQKDLGGALIFFVTYIFMLYVATLNPLYMIGGLAGGSVAAVVAYRLFSHVRVRVVAWRHPFDYIDKEGYQVTQSLFAIGTGGWFGMGLMQGLPSSIPVVDSDFIFAAISEEMGGLFALFLILIYINCFIVLIRISLKIEDKFYSLLSVGFSVMFGFQVFLCIGGVIKFIPSTGVTLPFISSGGSSVFSKIFMFMIVQGVYILGQKNKRVERSRK